MEYYKVFLYNIRTKDYSILYVYTNDIRAVKKSIEADDLFIEVENWEVIRQGDIPAMGTLHQM